MSHPFHQARSMKTEAGSTVRLKGAHGGDITIDFDWLEEGGCIDCEVDLDASRDTNWRRLVWACISCDGGSANLAPATE
jgi:hypothetical protein